MSKKIYQIKIRNKDSKRHWKQMINHKSSQKTTRCPINKKTFSLSEKYNSVPGHWLILAFMERMSRTYRLLLEASMQESQKIPLATSSTSAIARCNQKTQARSITTHLGVQQKSRNSFYSLSSSRTCNSNIMSTNSLSSNRNKSVQRQKRHLPRAYLPN